MSENKFISAIVRSVYLFVMYTGIRALANRVRCVFLPMPRAAVIDGAIIQLDESVSCRVRVHARTHPGTSAGARVGGMISVYLEHPGIPRWLYSLLCVTSHFGCGHMELAFCEEDRSVCVFAVRNMLRSSLDRIGCSTWFRNLLLLTERDEIVVLVRILDDLRSRGLNPYLASPAECVNLAVSPWLLRPTRRARAITALTRKYERMARQVALHVNPLPGEAQKTNKLCCCRMPSSKPANEFPTPLSGVVRKGLVKFERKGPEPIETIVLH